FCREAAAEADAEVMPFLRVGKGNESQSTAEMGAKRAHSRQRQQVIADPVSVNQSRRLQRRAPRVCGHADAQSASGCRRTRPTDYRTPAPANADGDNRLRHRRPFRGKPCTRWAVAALR